MWKNEESPEQGFDGLYLTDEALSEVKDLVDVKRIGGFNQLTGVIGKEVPSNTCFSSISRNLINLIHLSATFVQHNQC